MAQLAANQRMQKARLSSAISQCVNGLSFSAIERVPVDPCSNSASIPPIETSAAVVVVVSVGALLLIVGSIDLI